MKYNADVSLTVPCGPRVIFERPSAFLTKFRVGTVRVTEIRPQSALVVGHRQGGKKRHMNSKYEEGVLCYA